MARCRKICLGCFDYFYPDSSGIKYCSNRCRSLVQWEKREARLLDEGASDTTIEKHHRSHPKYRVKQFITLSAQAELDTYVKCMSELREERLKSGEMDNITLDALMERDNRRCHICGGKVSERRKFGKQGTPRGNMSKYPTIDHIKPVSKGGGHTWGNVKLAHWACNSKRGASDSLTVKGQLIT